ncbi:MAG: SEL1-like repeat protein [Alphaproteobacteria bacterium]|nr:SEL1-like repeat protein [Alphaproteobacteria bacterium]
MTRRKKRQRMIRRSLFLALVAFGVSLIGSQLMAQDARSCNASHGTVAGVMAQQFETVASAARAGNPVAMIEVAQMYRDGLGVTRDLVLAQAWSSLASDRGAEVSKFHNSVSACLSRDEIRQAGAKVLALLQEEEELGE